MTKKKKTTKSTNKDHTEDYIPSISVSVGADSMTTSSKDDLVGTIISLNQKNQTFFGLGQIWLSPNRYWCSVPDNLTADEYKLISKAIADGRLVRGKKFIPPVDKDPRVLSKYWNLVKSTGIETTEAKNEFMDLLRKEVIGGYTAREIANHCIRMEKDYQSRKKALAVLEEVRSRYFGPTYIHEEPDDDAGEGIRVHAFREAAENDENANKEKPPAPPRTHKPGNKSAEETLNNLFE